jgi:hypothetical protein
MSISVELPDLRSAVADTDRAPYLLTVSDDGRPHAVAVVPEWRDDDLALAVGNRSLANARARPRVSLVWPARDAPGYTLIVDADVTGTTGGGDGDNVVVVHPTHAVLHRPATGTTDTDCGADCAPVSLA